MEHRRQPQPDRHHRRRHHRHRQEGLGVPLGEAPNGSAAPLGDLFGYADAEDATAKAIVKVPVAAYVEKVYEESDFSGLGIGT